MITFNDTIVDPAQTNLLKAYLQIRLAWANISSGDLA